MIDYSTFIYMKISHDTMDGLPHISFGVDKIESYAVLIILTSFYPAKFMNSKRIDFRYFLFRSIYIISGVAKVRYHHVAKYFHLRKPVGI